MHFQYFECFLLALPVAWIAWRFLFDVGTDRVTTSLRILLLSLLVFALAGPELNVGGAGLDVIVIADRSASLDDRDQASIAELIQNLENNRNSGDRVGLVAFGRSAVVERFPSREAQFAGFEKTVTHDASNLGDALTTALTLVDPNRPARVLVLSDGETTGGDSLSAARRAREMRVPIDYRLYEHPRDGDVAITALSLPTAVSPREPFQFTVRVFADAETSARIVVKREGQPFAEREVTLQAGDNTFPFREVLDAGGFFQYSAEVLVENDPLPANNLGVGGVRVDDGPRLLVLSSDGSGGNLVRALQAARIPVDTASAKSHPLTQDSLDQYRAVILENVPANDLGRLKMARLAQYVEDLGGGLMVTGGKRSFGVGGYYKSPLDDVMPVSMELREEHRKLKVAIAVVLDRSGSMAAPVRGGATKMDLANLGTAEVVRLLSRNDMVSVIAVDTSPHIVQELTKVTDPEAIAGRVRGIQSEGGGIYVYNALVAAGEQLLRADGYATRHIILFSDAQDSEQPGDYKRLVDEYTKVGITVSVIGLGTDTDSDAALLKDIATLGNGNVMFTDDAEELPRLFTQDTMSVARNMFIEATNEQPDGIPGVLLPEPARLMGDLRMGALPGVGGYNLSYLKPQATAAAISQDEYAAPFSAFWYRGLGRVSAVTLEVDGPASGGFATWGRYDDFLITHARWLLGGDDPHDVFVDVQRDGQDAIVTVELDPRTDAATGLDTTNTVVPSAAPRLLIIPPGAERENTRQPELTWVGPYTLQGRFPLDRLGTFRTVVQSGRQRLTRGPAVSLPYSPEFEPRPDDTSGKRLLQEIGGMTEGVLRTDVVTILNDPPFSPRMIPLLPYLLIAAVVLLLMEIAGRRLSLWRRTVAPAEEPLPAGVPALPSEDRSLRKRWQTGWAKTRERFRKRPDETPITPTAAAAKPTQPTAGELFAQAKQRARRRND